MYLNSPWEVIAIGFTISFFVVQNRPRIKLFDRKPFKCMPCMTAWGCFGAALASGYMWESFLYIPIGYFIGAMFEAIKMRWL